MKLLAKKTSTSVPRVGLHEEKVSVDVDPWKLEDSADTDMTPSVS